MLEHKEVNQEVKTIEVNSEMKLQGKQHILQDLLIGGGVQAEMLQIEQMQKYTIKGKIKGKEDDNLN